MAVFPEPVVFTGTVNLASASAVQHRAGSITDSAIADGADVSTDKLRHRHHVGTDFGLAISGSVTTREEMVFMATRACTVRSFAAGLAGENTTGTTAFDLKKNGTTVLTGSIDVTSSEGTGRQAGTLSGVVTLAAGDRLSVAMTNSGGDGTGPYAYAEVDERGV